MRNAQGLLLVYATVFSLVMASCTEPQKSTPLSTPTAHNNEGFAVTIPQKTLYKNKVTVSVETTPGTDCELTYVSPSGDASFMDNIVADTNGLCSWTWRIDETKGRGAGRLIFTIEGISETHFIEIRSSF
jgi:hypothetical protein